MLSLCMTQCVLGFYENKVVSASKAKDIDKGLLTFLFFINLYVHIPYEELGSFSQTACLI